jgi:hypothetical protein
VEVGNANLRVIECQGAGEGIDVNSRSWGVQKVLAWMELQPNHVRIRWSSNPYYTADELCILAFLAFGKDIALDRESVGEFCVSLLQHLLTKFI